MKTNNINPVLATEIEQCGFVEKDYTDKLKNFISAINEKYEALNAELKILEADNAIKTSLISHAGRLASLGEMASAMAHELNQPLSIIRADMQTLDILKSNELSSEDLTDIISSSIRQVDRASNIVTHIRNFTRKNTNDYKLVNMAASIESALSIFNEQFRLHEINVIRNFDESIPDVLLEEHQLEQLSIHLLSNARHAVETMKQKIGSQFKMEIHINLHHDKNNKQLLFEMIDNGIGMSTDVQEHCREPFFTTKQIEDNTGLGLVIVDNIVNTLKGDLEIKSESEKGTSVCIKIPVGE